MNNLIKITSLSWALLYVALVIGLPIYQVHCSCTGQTTVALLVAPASCNDDTPSDVEIDHPNDCQNHCVSLAKQCDKTQLAYLQFSEIQNISPLQHKLPDLLKTKPMALCCVTFNISSWRTTLHQPLKSNWLYQDVGSFIYALSATEYLRFICQHKEPSVA